MNPEGAVRVFLGLGANAGQRIDQLRTAVDALVVRYENLGVAGVYVSPPEDGSDPPDYLNTVVGFTTRDDAEAVLACAAELERQAGRVSSVPGAARPLDVDVLFYGDMVCTTPRLTLPHPRWAGRPFVVVPLLDLAPRWTDPVSGSTVEEVARSAGWDGRSLTRRLPPGALRTDASGERS